MTRYSGDRTIDGPCVLRDGTPLAMTAAPLFSEAVDWGCDAPPARQLAFALLVDHLADQQRAIALVPGFTQQVVARLDNDWAFDDRYLDRALEIIESA